MKKTDKRRATIKVRYLENGVLRQVTHKTTGFPSVDVDINAADGFASIVVFNEKNPRSWDLYFRSDAFVSVEVDRG